MIEGDKKIKNQWLLMLALSMFISSVNSLLPFWFEPSLKPFILAKYLSSAFVLLSVFGMGYVLYYCIHKKPGTKLLTFCLIMTVTSLVITPILYFRGQLILPNYFPYYGAFVFLSQVSGFLWGIVCWRMRKLNKKLQVLSRNSA